MTTTAVPIPLDHETGPGRRLGIPAILEAPWGTHFCQFYRTKQDLLDTLVPYFKAGLESNEFCMWITAEPLTTDEAITAMRDVMPDFDLRLADRQIEIMSYLDWYLVNGSFDGDRVLQAWVDKLTDARARGLDGLRLTGNTFWLERSDWADFTEYEATINSVIGQHNMIALCTYSLDRCSSSEIIDVVVNHQFALIKRDDQWTLIEPSERKAATHAVEVMNQALKERTAQLQAALAELNRQSDERQRLAREMNDTIVQGLVATELSFDLGEGVHSRELLRGVSRQARTWVGQLLQQTGPLQPGEARRQEPAHHGA